MSIKRKLLSFIDMIKHNIIEDYTPTGAQNTSKTIYGAIKSIVDELAEKAESSDLTDYKQEVEIRITAIETRLDALDNAAGNNNLALKTQLELIKAQGILDNANAALVNAANKSRVELTAQKTAVTSSINALNNIKTELKKNKESTTDVDNMITKLTEVSGKLDTVIANKNTAADTLEAERTQKLQDATTAINANNAIINNAANKTKEDLVNAKNDLQNQVDILKELKRKLEAAGFDTDDVDTKIAEINGKITETETLINKANTEIANKDKEAQDAANTALQQSAAAAIAAAEVVKQTANTTLNKADNTKDELNTAKNNLQSEITKLKAIKNQLNAAGLDTADVDNKIAELEALIAKINTEITNRDNNAANTALQQSVTAAIAAAEVVKQAANTTLNKADNTKDDLKAAKNNLQSEITKLKAIKNQLNAAGLDTADVDNKIAELEQVVTNIDNKIPERPAKIHILWGQSLSEFLPEDEAQNFNLLEPESYFGPSCQWEFPRTGKQNYSFLLIPSYEEELNRYILDVSWEIYDVDLDGNYPFVDPEEDSRYTKTVVVKGIEYVVHRSSNSTAGNAIVRITKEDKVPY